MAEARFTFVELLLPVAVAVALLANQSRIAPHQETIASLEARLRLRPADMEDQEQLANLLVRSGRMDEAIAHYRTVLVAAPQSASAAYGLAMALTAKGGAANALEAQKTLEKTLTFHPDDAPANEALADMGVQSLKEMAYPLAQKMYERALKSDPTRTRSALGLSQIYLAQGRLIDAGRVLIKPRDAHPRDAAIHLQLARLLALAGDYDHADLEYNAGTAQDAKNSQAYGDWGKVLVDAGKPQNAVKVLRIALQLDPNNPLYHVQLARALRDSGLFTEAMSEFTLALDKDIQCSPAYLELAATFERLHTDEGDRTAENFLRQGMLANPTDLHLKVALAVFLSHAADPAKRDSHLWESVALLQECVEKTHKSDIGVLVAAAEAWSRVGSNDKSLDLLQDAIAWGQAHNLIPDQLEMLLSYRQKYQIADMPPAGRNLTPYLSVDGRIEHDPMDDPWPDPLQPRMDLLINKSMDLRKVPGPGSALDPHLYIGDNVKPFFGPGMMQ